MENQRHTREEVTQSINKLKERQPSALLPQDVVYYIDEIFSGECEDQEEDGVFNYKPNHNVDWAENGSDSSDEFNLADVASD